jgi:rod shape-determining protein MreD
LKPNFERLRSWKIKNFIALVILVSAAIIQSTLSRYLKINGVHPDLVLILVIGWTSLHGLREGLTWALIGGLSLDFISGAPFGIFSLAMLAVTVAANLSQGRILGSTIVLPLSLTFPLTFMFNALALLLLNLLGWPVAWLDAFSNVLLPLALFNTGVMLLIFPLLAYLNRLLDPQRLSF